MLMKKKDIPLLSGSVLCLFILTGCPNETANHTNGSASSSTVGTVERDTPPATTQNRTETTAESGTSASTETASEAIATTEAVTETAPEISAPTDIASVESEISASIETVSDASTETDATASDDAATETIMPAKDVVAVTPKPEVPALTTPAATTASEMTDTVPETTETHTSASQPAETTSTETTEPSQPDNTSAVKTETTPAAAESTEKPIVEEPEPVIVEAGLPLPASLKYRDVFAQNQVVAVTFSIKNELAQAITVFDGNVILIDSAGNKIANLALQAHDIKGTRNLATRYALAKGASKIWGLSIAAAQYPELYQRLKTEALSQFKVHFLLTSVQYADGTRQQF